MGYVYLICDPSNDSYKIGVTNKDINKRIQKLQTGNCEELFISSFYKCEYPFRLEKMLHTRFANKRIHGEWFKLSSHDIGQFRNTCEELLNILESIRSNPFINFK